MPVTFWVISWQEQLLMTAFHQNSWHPTRVMWRLKRLKLHCRFKIKLYLGLRKQNVTIFLFYQRASTLFSMKHGLVRLDNVWGVGGGVRPVKSLVTMSLNHGAARVFPKYNFLKNTFPNIKIRDSIFSKIDIRVRFNPMGSG